MQEIDKRIKTNEDIYDSEMDQFKGKIDYLINELMSFKDGQGAYSDAEKPASTEEPATGPGVHSPADSGKDGSKIYVQKPQKKPSSPSGSSDASE